MKAGQPPPRSRALPGFFHGVRTTCPGLPSNWANRHRLRRPATSGCVRVLFGAAGINPRAAAPTRAGSRAKVISAPAASPSPGVHPSLPRGTAATRPRCAAPFISADEPIAAHGSAIAPKGRANPNQPGSRQRVTSSRTWLPLRARCPCPCQTPPTTFAPPAEVGRCFEPRSGGIRTGFEGTRRPAPASCHHGRRTEAATASLRSPSYIWLFDMKRRIFIQGGSAALATTLAACGGGRRQRGRRQSARHRAARRRAGQAAGGQGPAARQEAQPHPGAGADAGSHACAHTRSDACSDACPDAGAGQRHRLPVRLAAGALCRRHPAEQRVQRQHGRGHQAQLRRLEGPGHRRRAHGAGRQGGALRHLDAPTSRCPKAWATACC